MTLLGWLRDRRVTVLLILFNLPWIIGFMRVEYVNDRTDQQVDQGAALVTCLSTYAVELTEALQDRDTVAIVARGASVELWETFRDLLVHPRPGDQGRREFLTALRVYLRTLDQLDRTASLNPYPDPADCFEQIGEAAPGYVLAVFSSDVPVNYPGKWDDTCWNRRVNLRGTIRSDVIHGTDGRDVIFAYSGADLIVSGQGRDRVCGRFGDDTINAGQGFDRVNCGRGVDNAQQAERTRRCEN